MKKIIYLVLILFSSILSLHAQIFLETKDGEEIVNPFSVLSSTAIFGKANINDKSLELKGLIKSGSFSAVSIGVKGSATNNVATLFTKGSLNPGANVNLTYSQFNIILDKKNIYTDFLLFKIDYNVNKQIIFDSQQVYTKQVKEENFKGGSATLSYGLLLSGKSILSFALGLSWRNNYSKLEEIEVRDYRSTFSDSLKTSRVYGKNFIAKAGDYKAFRAFPLKLHYTLAPPEDSTDKNKLSVGFTTYYSTEFGAFTPMHNIGLLFFVTKQDEKSGIRAPIIGLGFQISDFTENITPSTFLNMISVNLTTVFNILTL